MRQAGGAAGAGGAGGIGGMTGRANAKFSPQSSRLRKRSNPNPEPDSGSTFRVTRWPSRITTAGTLRPDGVSCTNRVSCRALRTRSPSNSTMMSPLRIPPFAAALSSDTSSTTAPDGVVSPDPFKSSSSTSRTEMPRRLPPPTRTAVLGNFPLVTVLALDCPSIVDATTAAPAVIPDRATTHAAALKIFIIASPLAFAQGRRGSFRKGWAETRLASRGEVSRRHP